MTKLNLFKSITLSLAFTLSACSPQQQDSFFQQAINFDRQQSGLSLKSLQVSDSKLAYLEGGQGETVVLLHGFSANKDNWNKFAKELVKDYHLITLDLAGHGDSSLDLNISFELQDQVQRVRELSLQLGLKRFHIMGNSMGGAISALYANAYPEQIISLGLMDSAGLKAPTPSPYMKALAEGKNPLIPKSPEDVDFLFDFALEQRPFIPWPITSVLARKSISRAEVNEKIFADMLKAKALLDNGQAEQLLASLQHPAIIIWGKQDRVLDVSTAEVFNQHLPNSQMVLMDNVGHMPMLEAPTKTAQHYRQFLSGL